MQDLYVKLNLSSYVLLPATTSLGASLFTVVRSCGAVAVLYGFCYAGLKEKQSKVQCEHHLSLQPCHFALVASQLEHRHTKTIQIEFKVSCQTHDHPLHFQMSSEVPGQSNTSAHVLFSVYCGLVVPVSYHLSRCASDPSVLWSV